VISYSTDKICVQNLLLYTEHVFWFQLFVIDLIFWHITFTTDLCAASKIVGSSVEVLGSVLGVKNRQVLGPGFGLEAGVRVNIPVNIHVMF